MSPAKTNNWIWCAADQRNNSNPLRVLFSASSISFLVSDDRTPETHKQTTTNKIYIFLQHHFLWNEIVFGFVLRGPHINKSPRCLFYLLSLVVWRLNVITNHKRWRKDKAELASSGDNLSINMFASFTWINFTSTISPFYPILSNDIGVLHCLLAAIASNMYSHRILSYIVYVKMHCTARRLQTPFLPVKEKQKKKTCWMRATAEETLFVVPMYVVDCTFGRYVCLCECVRLFWRY